MTDVQSVTDVGARRPGRNGSSSGFKFTDDMLSVLRKAVNSGMNDREIAKMFGCRRETIQARKKKAGIFSPRRSSIAVKLSSKMLNRLWTESERLGITSEQLVERLIVTIAADNLFDPLLED